MGEILDLRNKETCPNLCNLSTHHASKVKELLITALEKQIEIVNKLNAEDSKACGDQGGCGTSVLLTDLRSELKKVSHNKVICRMNDTNIVSAIGRSKRLMPMLLKRRQKSSISRISKLYCVFFSLIM